MNIIVVEDLEIKMYSSKFNNLCFYHKIFCFVILTYLLIIKVKNPMVSYKPLLNSNQNV